MTGLDPLDELLAQQALGVQQQHGDDDEVGKRKKEGGVGGERFVN
jgi:hypothetical protein